MNNTEYCYGRGFVELSVKECRRRINKTLEHIENKLDSLTSEELEEFRREVSDYKNHIAELKSKFSKYGWYFGLGFIVFCLAWFFACNPENIDRDMFYVTRWDLSRLWEKERRRRVIFLENSLVGLDDDKQIFISLESNKDLLN